MMAQLVEIRQPDFRLKIAVLFGAIIVDCEQIEDNWAIGLGNFSGLKMAVGAENIGIGIRLALKKHRHLLRLSQDFWWQFGDGLFDDALGAGFERFPAG